MTSTIATARPLHADGRYADIDWNEYRRLCRAAKCPRPHCQSTPGDDRAGVGADCTTPNGWGSSFHREREQAAGVRPAPGRANSRHRLSEPQAQRIEWAAEAGVYYAPARTAVASGEARERTIADVLVREGLVEEDPATASDNPHRERRLLLTAAGWDTYWHHRLIIRRLPAQAIQQHAATCPRCTRTQ